MPETLVTATRHFSFNDFRLMLNERSDGQAGDLSSPLHKLRNLTNFTPFSQFELDSLEQVEFKEELEDTLQTLPEFQGWMGFTDKEWSEVRTTSDLYDLICNSAKPKFVPEYCT